VRKGGPEKGQLKRESVHKTIKGGNMKKKILRIAICLMVITFTLSVIPVYSAAQDNKININTAGVEDLIKLEKIGPAYAKRIVEYREKYGPFKKIEDLTNVKGIGEITLELIKDKLTVGTLPE
jgi:competence protein ComEA